MVLRGVHLGLLKIQELWLKQEASFHISVLELWAIYNACHTFWDCIRDLVFQIFTDNTTLMY